MIGEKIFFNTGGGETEGEIKDKVLVQPISGSGGPVHAYVVLSGDEIGLVYPQQITMIKK